MFFQKKKEMVDIRDLPRKNAAFGKSFVPKDGYGFVDLTKKRILPSELRKMKGMQTTTQPQTSSASTFSFFDTPTPSPSFGPSSFPVSSSSSSETEELLRKVSMQISDLDSKMYKMEQRIELLEKKAGITDSSGSGFNW